MLNPTQLSVMFRYEWQNDITFYHLHQQVVNLVVFKDGQASMLFEHSALDGMVAGLVVERLWQLSESENREKR